VRKFLYQALTKGYNAWYDWYLDMKEQERCVRKALAKWIKQKLSAAFNSWNEWYQDLIAERLAIRRALAKWANGQVLNAFTWWRTGRLESQLELHSRAALFWLNRMMGGAWRTWREGAASHQAEKDELLEEIERLRKVLMDGNYIHMPKLSGEEDHAKLLKAMKMWQHLALARGFNTLKWALAVARDNRSVALKVMTYWCNQQIAKGFNSWRAFYFEMLALKRSMSFWINRAMGAAWNTWVTWVDDLHRQRMAARNAVMRWRYMQLYAG